MGKIIHPDKKRKYLGFLKSKLGKISQREIARRLKIGKTTVNRWAMELGFKHKKHTVNESFFDEFNEYSAYTLGFIYADGNISWNPEKGYQSLTITAAAKDNKHLEKIRNLLRSTKPLLYSPKTKSYRLIANSKRLCLKLMRLGVIPKKSLTVTFPEDIIPKEYLQHFIRGIIDGDGSVHYFKRKKSPYFLIGVASGSKKFCKGLVKAIDSAISVKANIIKRKNNTYVITYTCTKGKKLANYVYYNARIFLDRKYSVYKNNILEVN